MKRLRSYRASAADLLLGSACAGCAQPGPVLCPVCARDLEALPREVRPDPCRWDLPPVYAVAAYEGMVRAALLAHKEEARLALAKPLGAALALSVLGLLAEEVSPRDPLYLVPAPSRPGVVRERGHDPLLRLARRCSEQLRQSGVDARVTPLLRTRRKVADQAGLGAQERADNLANAFAVSGIALRRRRLGGLFTVVVDDIITSGATAAEASRALTAADAYVHGVAVIAATERHLATRLRQGAQRSA